MLRLVAYPDGTLLASEALGEADHVYTTETTSPCSSRSTYPGGLIFSATRAGAANEVAFGRGLLPREGFSRRFFWAFSQRVTEAQGSRFLGRENQGCL